MADEETRAAAYRAQQKARVANKAAAERALRGDSARAKALRDATEALLPVNSDGVPRVGMEDRA